MGRLSWAFVSILTFGVIMASGKRHWSFTRGGPYGIDPCFHPTSLNCRLSRGRSLGGVIGDLFPGTFDPCFYPGIPGCGDPGYTLRGGGRMMGRRERTCIYAWNSPGCIWHYYD